MFSQRKRTVVPNQTSFPLIMYNYGCTSHILLCECDPFKCHSWHISKHVLLLCFLSMLSKALWHVTSGLCEVTMDSSCISELWQAQVTHLGGCTHLPLGGPSLWRGLRTADVRSRGRRPWASHWSCRTSGWARGSLRCRRMSPCSGALSLSCSWLGSSRACVLSHPSCPHDAV